MSFEEVSRSNLHLGTLYIIQAMITKNMCKQKKNVKKMFRDLSMGFIWYIWLFSETHTGQHLFCAQF